MVKILFLITNLTGGGAEKVLVDLVNNLDKNKYNITVQTIADVGIHRKNLNSNINYRTIAKSKNPIFQKIIEHIVSFILPAKVVYKFFIGKDYDYEVAFLEGLPTKMIAASTNKNARKYAWVHVDLFNNYNLGKVYKEFNKSIIDYKRYDKILCVSEDTRKLFYKRFGLLPNVEVLYNVLDDKKIVEKANENISSCIECEKFIFISVGRLNKQKGFDRLLEAHLKLIKEGFEHKLYILGEGPERQLLENYIFHNSLSDSAILLGFQNNPYPFILMSDAFISSSRAEGFSLVVAEAIILGKPVISTKTAGPIELLDSGEYGLLVDNSIDGIYKGMKCFLQDKKVFDNFSKKSKERSSDFKLDNSIKMIENLFR